MHLARQARACWLVCVLAWACVGCETSTVALGTECPDFAAECRRNPTENGGNAEALPDDAAVTAPVDAGFPLPPLDAGPASEPEPPLDGGLDVTMGLRNGSFEVTTDPDRLGDLDPPSDIEIAPWVWCRGDVEVHDQVDDRLPSDGANLLSLDHALGTPAIDQELEAPLVPGQRYALAFDADRNRLAPFSLHVVLYGGDETCAPLAALAESEPLPASEDDTLTAHCVTFVADAAYRHLVLGADPGALEGKVFLDNLRAVPTCP